MMSTTMRRTTRQAAAYIAISNTHLKRLRQVGAGPRFIKIGRKVLYDEADLDRWIENQKQPRVKRG